MNQSTTSVETVTKQPIFITEKAVRQVKNIRLEEENGEQLSLRIFVTGGGCSGLQYGFTFESEANDDDLVIERDGMKFLVDCMSIAYLEGAEIDYSEDINGSQFVIKNPQASTSCGCGSSFSV